MLSFLSVTQVTNQVTNQARSTDTVVLINQGTDMAESRKIDRWVEGFPFLRALEADQFAKLAKVVQFPVLEIGQVAYQQDWECPNYIMCVEGRTRVYKTSGAGREVLIYKVEGGGTCVLTTQCLLSNSNFPAESVAETRTELAILPKSHFHKFMAEIPAFRDYVIADYTRLLGMMFSLIDTVAFATTEQRLARRLLAEAAERRVVDKTHQQLASDIGTVREIVSRHLGDWERKGWVISNRGQIQIVDKSALASRQAQ
ncbi:Transcriptional regulator SdrP [Methylovirgula sp. HY1]|nr:Transcriptional regulator SdrP [Methylovirgula sp. HY1]